jgi:integrase
VTSEAQAEASAVKLYRNLQQRALQVTLAGGRQFASSVATLRQEIETYLATVKRKKSRRGRPTSPITLRRYRDGLELFASWCETERSCGGLNELNRDVLSAWKTSRFDALAHGEPREVSTVNQEVKPIRQMLVAAALAGRLVHLTSDAIRGALKRETQPAPTPRCYSVPEIRATLRAALDYDVSPSRPRRSAAFAPIVAAALLAGMRRGELAKLQVEDVLFDAPSEYDPDITTGLDLVRLPGHKTKTGAPRDVQMAPYSPMLGQLLRALIEDRTGREYVFRMSYQTLGSRAAGLSTASKAKHYPPRGFCLKDLRSTCATYQSPLPGNAKAKADRLGHTLQVAEQHYLALPSGTPLTAPNLEAVMQCSAELQEIISRVIVARLTAKNGGCK